MTGHNSIKMQELASLFKLSGYPDAETYIQSGNIVFSCPGEENRADTSSKINKIILKRFNLNISVITRTAEELKQIIRKNPFVGEPGFNPSRMAVLFLDKKPSDDQIHKVIHVDYPPDKFSIIGNEIFIYCPNGFGKTKLYTNFFEMKMGVTGTARNWRTVNKLLEMAEKKS
jgi:uncharacterized protein (DUF1697 family)